MVNALAYLIALIRDRVGRPRHGRKPAGNDGGRSDQPGQVSIISTSHPRITPANARCRPQNGRCAKSASGGSLGRDDLGVAVPPQRLPD
jgi:hypothetical protein